MANFVNFQDWLKKNQKSVAGMQGKLAEQKGQLEEADMSAKNTLNSKEIQESLTGDKTIQTDSTQYKAAQSANDATGQWYQLAGNQEGQQALLKNAYGRASGADAALLGNQKQGLAKPQEGWQKLGDWLGGYTQNQVNTNATAWDAQQGRDKAAEAERKQRIQTELADRQEKIGREGKYKGQEELGKTAGTYMSQANQIFARGDVKEITQLLNNTGNRANPYSEEQVAEMMATMTPKQKSDMAWQMGDEYAQGLKTSREDDTANEKAYRQWLYAQAPIAGGMPDSTNARNIWNKSSTEERKHFGAKA